MKLVLASALTLALVGCGDPIPPSQWKQQEISLKTVQGFEDCTLAVVKFHENAWPITLVRCPISQVSIADTKRNGKHNVQQTTGVVEQDPHDAKIAALVAELEHLQRELAELKK